MVVSIRKRDHGFNPAFPTVSKISFHDTQFAHNGRNLCCTRSIREEKSFYGGWSDKVQSTSSEKSNIHKRKKREKELIVLQTAADIVHQVTKKLIDLSVEGAKVIDLCVEGDKLLEQGTGAVYNKNVKGVKVSKGTPSYRSGIVLYAAHWRTSLGVSFPTCISVNNAVAHFSPLA